MAESPPLPPVSTFVVRLWHEWSANGPRWRGRIEHLQSGESRAFLDFDGLPSFMRRFAALHDEAGQPARKDGGRWRPPGRADSDEHHSSGQREEYPQPGSNDGVGRRAGRSTSFPLAGEWSTVGGTRPTPSSASPNPLCMWKPACRILLARLTCSKQAAADGSFSFDFTPVVDWEYGDGLEVGQWVSEIGRRFITQDSPEITVLPPGE